MTGSGVITADAVINMNIATVSVKNNFLFIAIKIKS